MSICKCGTYRRYGDEIKGRIVAPSKHLDACVNCGTVPNQSKLSKHEHTSDEPLLGDKVAAVFENVGIKAVTDYIHEKTGFDCGCNKRREQLNEFSKKWGKP